MAIEVIVPRLGWSMEEGAFSGWLKQDGERVQAGDALFVLEGDKTLQEIESLDSGILRIPPHAPKPGDAVKVGQVLAYLIHDGESLPESKPISAPPPAQTSSSVPTMVAATAAASPAPRPAVAGSKGRLRISPRARRAATALQVDASAITGTGKLGRIRERDVKAAVK